MGIDTPLLTHCEGASVEHWVRYFPDGALRKLANDQCFVIAGNPNMRAMNPDASGAVMLLYATNHTGDVSHVLCYKSDEWEFPKGGRDIRIDASPQHGMDILDLTQLIPEAWTLDDWRAWAKSASEKPLHKYIKNTQKTQEKLERLRDKVDALQEELDDTTKKKQRKKLKTRLKDIKKKRATLEQGIDDDPLEQIYESFMEYCFNEMSYDGESDYLDAKKLLRTIAGLRDDVGYSTEEWDILENDVKQRLQTQGVGEPASMAALSEAMEEVKGLNPRKSRSPIIRIGSYPITWRALGVDHTLAFVGLEMPLKELERLDKKSKKTRLFTRQEIETDTKFHSALQAVAPEVLDALNQHQHQQETLQTVSLSP